MNKKILGLGLLSIFLIGSIGIAMGQPIEKWSGVPSSEGKPPFRTPRPHMQPVHVGHGFAIDGGEFHVLSVNIIKTRVLSPRDIRNLLRGRMSIKEIREALEKDNRVSIYRGHMKFAGQHYILNITSLDNRSLDADVLKLPSGKLDMPSMNESIEPEVLGHISIEVMDYEGSRVGTGTLDIDGKSYSVLLNIASPRKFPGRGPLGKQGIR